MSASERKPIIAANWKMHHDHLVAIQVVQKLSYRLVPEDYEACDVVIAPPFTDLRTIQTLTESDSIPIALGAQNCYWKDDGAFTGEISPPMLAKLNVAYVIVGHSERRQLFGETDEIVNAKTKAVHLRRGNARGARARHHRRARRRTDAGRVRRGEGRAGRTLRARLRTDLGDRHRSQRDARRRKRHDRRHPRRRA
jgi:hypothetical protein